MPRRADLPKALRLSERDLAEVIHHADLALDVEKPRAFGGAMRRSVRLLESIWRGDELRETKKETGFSGGFREYLLSFGIWKGCYYWRWVKKKAPSKPQVLVYFSFYQ